MFFRKADCWIIHGDLKCRVCSLDDLILHCKVIREHFPGSSATLRWRVEGNEYFELDFCPDETAKIFLT